MLCRLTIRFNLLFSFRNGRFAFHIMNHIIKERLKSQIHSIDLIQNMVKYVRSFLKRKQAFMLACGAVGMKLDRKMWLDNNTRWNFTYLMLTKVIAYKEALMSFKAIPTFILHRRRKSYLHWCRLGSSLCLYQGP